MFWLIATARTIFGEYSQRPVIRQAQFKLSAGQIKFLETDRDSAVAKP